MTESNVRPLRTGMDALQAFLRVNDYPIHETPQEILSARARAYAGQAHTLFGERGKTPVKGVTFRDLGDAIACSYSYLTKKGVEDPAVFASEALLLVEHMMGIFPNIPRLKEEQET